MSLDHTTFGSWKSPITADLIADRTVTLSQVVCGGADVYWSETRPTEAGRNVIMRHANGRIEEVLPMPYDARTRTHEYGGGAFTIVEGVIYFSNFSDHRIYRLRPGSEPAALTPASSAHYADFVVDPLHRRIICVREQHAGIDEPVNMIVSVDLDRVCAPQVLVSGCDFYANPRLSPDGRYLAWLSWNHPNMPWDATELYLAEFGPDGSLGAIRRVAGGTEESVFQPEFAPDGTLYFVSDQNGWWNLYRYANQRTEAVLSMEAEFGAPQWVFGLSTYAFFSSDRIVCTYNNKGTWQLGIIDTHECSLRPIGTPYIDIGFLKANRERVVFVGATPTMLPAVVELNLVTERCTQLRASSSVCLEPGYLSSPHRIEYETADQETAYAFFYPPRNHDIDPCANEKPPLLVTSHGGPTSSASAALNLKIQYWTSRGFAVLDVNYRGSTGYGRRYRERLYGQWGIVDVEDCIYGARYLVQQGLVDETRLAIRGSSASGYTTLCALTFHHVFKTGASYYGISDLEALAHDTHKFEAHYLDRLIGPYPEYRDLYRERSPIHHADQLACPIIFFQGLEDKVVPPSQTERMVAALRSRGIRTAYLSFAGEAHGFRRAENIKQALEAELCFYGREFGFSVTDMTMPSVTFE